MRRTIFVLAMLGSTAYAADPTGSLRTSGVGVDQAGVCWVQGPANVLRVCGATGSPHAVTAVTVLPSAGYWLIVPLTGTPVVVNADGTTTVAGTAGNAFPIVQ
jgi:hypothetical protein